MRVSIRPGDMDKDSGVACAPYPVRVDVRPAPAPFRHQMEIAERTRGYEITHPLTGNAQQAVGDRKHTVRIVRPKASQPGPPTHQRVAVQQVLPDRNWHGVAASGSPKDSRPQQTENDPPHGASSLSEPVEKETRPDSPAGLQEGSCIRPWPPLRLRSPPASPPCRAPDAAPCATRAPRRWRCRSRNRCR